MTTPDEQNKKRLFSFDFLKAFCIFFVCLGHAMLFIFSEHDYSIPVVKYLYAFHMPLFMVISGFFFRSSLNKNFLTLIKEKSLQLLLPCFTFFIVIKVFKVQVYLNFWYLKCLFCMYIVYYILYKISENIKLNKVHYWFIIYIFFFIFAPFINYSLIQTYKFLFMFPFFGLGIFIRKQWKLFQKYSNIIFVISFFLTLIVFACWKTKYIIYFTPIKYFSFSGIDVSLLIASLIRWGTGCVISVFFIALFDLLTQKINQKNIISKYIQNVGAHSIEIYLLQSFMLEYSFIDYKKNLIVDSDYNIIFGVLFAIVAIIISMLISWLISKNRILNLIFFGKGIKK